AQLAQRIIIGVPGASLEPLTRALAGGRRELLLAAAEGLARQQRPEAFQPLLLAFTAGLEPERKRAIAALGELGDRRALEYLEPLLDPRADIPADDRALAPDAAEALGALLPRLADADEQKRLRDSLERLAREGSGDLRWRTLRGLRRIGDERSRTLLENLASDPYEGNATRQWAAAELGELGATAFGAGVGNPAASTRCGIAQGRAGRLAKAVSARRHPGQSAGVEQRTCRNQPSRRPLPGAARRSRHLDPAAGRGEGSAGAATAAARFDPAAAFLDRRAADAAQAAIRRRRGRKRLGWRATAAQRN
ncbi:MAG: hypothetical protein IPI57_09010, partial [Candidatus Competibacteraceae bacterium]|nr:hypothetical protein [Candidatus Competibacteraceae bacterium]